MNKITFEKGGKYYIAELITRFHTQDLNGMNELNSLLDYPGYKKVYVDQDFVERDYWDTCNDEYICIVGERLATEQEIEKYIRKQEKENTARENNELKKKNKELKELERLEKKYRNKS